MDSGSWLKLFTEQIKLTQPLEWIAVATGVAEVLLATANNVLLYPAGIVSTAIYIYLLAHSGLYADSLLNVYYLVMSIYGWWLWARKTDAPVLAITQSNVKEWGITTGIIVAGWIVLYTVLKNYTPSTVPAWDAWVAATAWAGMWLLAKRKIENWLVLNVSNLFAIPLLIHKELPLTAGLTLFLFIVAIFGYFKWKKQISVSVAS